MGTWQWISLMMMRPGARMLESGVQKKDLVAIGKCAWVKGSPRRRQAIIYSAMDKTLRKYRLCNALQHRMIGHAADTLPVCRAFWKEYSGRPWNFPKSLVLGVSKREKGCTEDVLRYIGLHPRNGWYRASGNKIGAAVDGVTALLSMSKKRGQLQIY